MVLMLREGYEDVVKRNSMPQEVDKANTVPGLEEECVLSDMITCVTLSTRETTDKQIL